MENKKELLEEEEKKQKLLEEEQEKLGKFIDKQREYSEWLKENKEKLTGNKYILYRLPLTHEQREKVYNNLVKEAKEKKEK